MYGATYVKLGIIGHKISKMAAPLNFEEAFPGEVPIHDNEEVEEDNNPIHGLVTVQTLRDNIVAPRTLRIYTSDLQHFLRWLQVNENQWLTPYGNEQLATIVVQQEDENDRVYKARTTREISDLLRHASTFPIVFLDQIRPERFMEYLFTLHEGRGTFLSKSAYGNKRASLNHLYRLHNSSGCPEAFKAELSNLYRGLYRQIAVQNINAANENEEGFVVHREGRLNMSTILYKQLAELFLGFGTEEGVFAHCYLIISWNLACRCNNTARIKFSQISWNTYFDAYSIMFATTKTDQLGDAAKYPRHIYANPFQPAICPVLALAIYLTTSFGGIAQIPNNGFLFPGEAQDNRFANILRRTINDNWEIVAGMGYQVGDIGTHSIRKGAVSYLHAIPDGPSEGSISVRAGWTMGRVKDIYIKYVASGDQFVGRCISLLSILRDDFGASPPLFINDGDNWIDETRRGQFRQIALVNGFEQLTKRLTASLLYHLDWLVENLPLNHTFLQSSMVHRNRLPMYINSTTVKYPWSDVEHQFTGIPANTAIMQKLEYIKNGQDGLGNVVEERTRQALENAGVNAGVVTPEMLQQLQQSLVDHINDAIGNNNGNNAPLLANDQHDGEVGMVMHYYGGTYKRIPEDWRFPRCSVHDLWRQWWLGDSVRNICPLRRLTSADVKHLDDIPIGINEQHGRKGRYAGNRRKSRKLLCDLKFLMQHVQAMVDERGLYIEHKSVATVDQMYNGVADYYNEQNQRIGQLNWISTVHWIRRRNRLEVVPNEG